MKPFLSEERCPTCGTKIPRGYGYYIYGMKVKCWDGVVAFWEGDRYVTY